jgi:hypothetical protein
MKTIEKLNDIKLYQWIELQEYLATNPPEDKIPFQTISILCDISTQNARKMNISDIEGVLSRLNEILQEKPNFEATFTLGGIEYGFIPNLDKITAGEFVDIEKFQDEFRDRKINLYKIMSVLYRPIQDKQSFGHYSITTYTGEINEAFKDMPIGIALGAHLFFCDLGNDLLTYIQSCLAPEKNESNGRKVNRVVGRLRGIFTRLTKNGDGLDGLSDFVIMTLSNLQEFRNCLSIRHSFLPVTALTTKNYKRKSTKTK